MSAPDVVYPLDIPALRGIVRRSLVLGPAGEACPPPADATFPEAYAETAGISLAIGVFDGVHLGHRSLLRACAEDALSRGAASVAVTFDPDPSVILGHAQSQLLSLAERVRAIRSCGIDRVEVIAFDEALMRTDYRDFVRNRLGALGTIRSMHVGSDFMLGNRGAGNVSRLSLLGSEEGFEVFGHDLVYLDGSVVTATRIRSLLSDGHVSRAASLLGRHHHVRGTVVRGRGEGTSFGFPTANVSCDARDCVPGEGVYAGVVVNGNLAWPAAINVGTPPTFTDARDGSFLEANLVGFDGSLYGHEVDVVFLEFLRESRSFDSLDELESVVLGNIAWVEKNVGSKGLEVRA